MSIWKPVLKVSIPRSPLKETEEEDVNFVVKKNRGRELQPRGRGPVMRGLARIVEAQNRIIIISEFLLVLFYLPKLGKIFRCDRYTGWYTRIIIQIVRYVC